jgi:hypothetical protein
VLEKKNRVPGFARLHMHKHHRSNDSVCVGLHGCLNKCKAHNCCCKCWHGIAIHHRLRHAPQIRAASNHMPSNPCLHVSPNHARELWQEASEPGIVRQVQQR